MIRYTLPLIVVVAIALAACSGAEEQVAVQQPVVEPTPVKEPVVDTRVFKYTERYAVRGALLAKATNVDDPVQALRVIQLVRGAHDALVISAFDKEGDTPTETWFGIEFPALKPGRYDLEQASAMQFYRFHLGDVRKRFDGSRARGTLVIEEFGDDAVIGSIEATIEGEMKSFDTPTETARVAFSGSFRIGRVNIEDTMIKGR